MKKLLQWIKEHKKDTPEFTSFAAWEADPNNAFDSGYNEALDQIKKYIQTLSPNK